MDKQKEIISLLKKWKTHRQIKKIIDKKFWCSIWLATISIIRNTALQPYDNIRDDNQEKEDISNLDKIIERLHAKWINIKVDYNWMKTYQNRWIAPFLWWDKNNVLIIWDLHCPYELEEYLLFCRQQQELFNCWTVIYIWDIVDFHSISYHEKIPEELNPRWEMSLARQRLKDWYYTFPEACVLLWNHDSIPYRQARTAWLLREFIRSPNTIFEAPNSYLFLNEIIINNVLYTHGTIWDAWTKCVKEWISLVQWHLHTKAWIIYHANRNWTIFGMQVWTWIDYKKQAFDYARSNSKIPVTSCWIMLNNLPIVIPMIWKN